jgi:hypothetical protein
MKGPGKAVVSRRYAPDTLACEEALRLLLARGTEVKMKAAEGAHPGGRDNAKEFKNADLRRLGEYTG